MESGAQSAPQLGYSASLALPLGTQSERPVSAELRPLAPSRISKVRQLSARCCRQIPHGTREFADLPRICGATGLSVQLRRKLCQRVTPLRT